MTTANDHECLYSSIMISTDFEGDCYKDLVRHCPSRTSAWGDLPSLLDMLGYEAHREDGNVVITSMKEPRVIVDSAQALFTNVLDYHHRVVLTILRRFVTKRCCIVMLDHSGRAYGYLLTPGGDGTVRIYDVSLKDIDSVFAGNTEQGSLS